MTKEEAKEILEKIKLQYDTSYEEDALDMAIKSLEAWGKVKKEIDASILICQEYAQDDTWCDGELAGFLQSKDIINGNLSEVSE